MNAHPSNTFIREVRQGASAAPPRFAYTDKGNGERLAARHGNDLRYCDDAKRWYVWDGLRWAVDSTEEVWRRAKETVDSMPADEAAYSDPSDLHKHALRSQSYKALRDMIACARSETGIAVRPEQFDRAKFLLNVLNGTIDLRTGELREPRREDLLTMLAPVEYDPHAECPLWDAMLHRVQRGSLEMVSFLSRAVGYSLTAATDERCFFILHGSGANGKSTFLETLRHMLGDYSQPVSQETLLAKREGTIPADVAKLKGSRFVIASETAEGRRLDEALIKSLTGNETIAARFLHANWFDFKPTFKIWLGTNHRPDIRTGGKALFDRVKLIPFTVAIPERDQDKQLAEKLRGETPGILNWAIRGCLEWQREGLGIPPQVVQATREYQMDVDAFGAFLEECCVIGDAMESMSDELHKAYDSWRLNSGEKELSKKMLGMKLKDRGFSGKHVEKGTRYFGLAVRYRAAGLTDDTS